MTGVLEGAKGVRVTVDGLGKTYADRSRSVEALRDITFTAPAGQLLCLVGPSGCGKTTLLKCVAGLLAPSRGSVSVEDRLVRGAGSDLAVVFQEYGRSLFPWLSARANVELPLRARGIGRGRRTHLSTEALTSVGLTAAADAYPWQLSGGMQQRVAIARALAIETPVLLMDEPFAAVDAQTRADLEDLVRSIWSRLGVTILFVTHDIDEAVYLGQRVVVLSGSPTVVLDDIAVDLPDERSQDETRSSAAFGRLRSRVYEKVQEAKRRTAD